MKLRAITNTVRELRQEKNWSQRALAEEAGICFTTVSKVEAGYQCYSLPSLLNICDSLEITMAELFDWTKL